MSRLVASYRATRATRLAKRLTRRLGAPYQNIYKGRTPAVTMLQKQAATARLAG
jgi:hypothetical protein